MFSFRLQFALKDIFSEDSFENACQIPANFILDWKHVHM